MARKKKKKKLWLVPQLPSLSVNVKPETVRSIYAILAGLLALVFLLAPFNLGGNVGNTLYGWLDSAFGFGYFLLPVSLIFLTLGLLRQDDEEGLGAARVTGAALLFASGIAILSLVQPGAGGMATLEYRFIVNRDEPQPCYEYGYRYSRLRRRRHTAP